MPQLPPVMFIGVGWRRPRQAPAAEAQDRRVREILALVQTEVAEVQPSWRIELVPGGHHWVFASHPAEVERLMPEFLR